MHKMKNLTHIGDNRVVHPFCTEQIYKVLQNVEYPRMQLSDFPGYMSTVFENLLAKK